MDKNILATLRPIPLFRAFAGDDAKLAVVAGLMASRKVHGGHTLIQEGALGDELFILKAGEVEVTKTTLEHEQYTVAVLRGSDHAFFGELALLDEDKRSASIVATSECEVLVLKRADFEALGNAHPELGLAIMRELAKILSRRLRTTDQDLILLFEALVNEVQAEELD